MCSINVLFNQECAVLAHVSIRSQPLFSSCPGQTRNTVFENPLIVFANLQLLTRTVRRLKILADAHGSIGINPPGKLVPEFVFFPDFAEASFAMRLVCGIELFALFLQRNS